MSSNQQTVKYVKMFDSPGVLEVKNIDTFEGQTVYFLEAEKGLIEPYSERLVERTFSNYSEVAHYLYGNVTEERLSDEEWKQVHNTEAGTSRGYREPEISQPDPVEEITYPINGFNNAHEVIEEAKRTGKPIADLIGKGLPTDWTQEQLIAACLRGECSEGYLANRLGIDRLEVRRLVAEYDSDIQTAWDKKVDQAEKQSYDTWLADEMKGI